MPDQLTEEQQSFWDDLRSPTKRTCWNCEHSFMGDCTLSAAYVCSRNWWADELDKDYWKWDGKSN